MARTYKRDSRGRFAGGGGSSSRGGGRKPMQRGTNRLTRDNAGRITSVGGDGATARGGRLRTASGKQRATVTAKGIGKAPAGTVGRSGKVKGAARVKAAAAKSPLRRTGQKIAAPTLKTNTERGRRGIVSMSTTAKQARRGAVAERKEEKRLRVMERQGGIVARRQGNRLSTYSSSGAFNQAAQNLNQSKLKKSKQIQSWLTTRNPADKPQSKRQKPATAKPAATVKPARRVDRAASKVDTSASAIARRRQRAMADRSSIAGGQFNMKLNTRSAIIRSAANEIYNRQRQIAKASGGRIDPAVAREAIGALRGLSGTKRQRAEQLREKARRRIASGRRR